MPRNECGGPKAAKVSGKPKFSVIQGGKSDDHNPDADFEDDDDDEDIREIASEEEIDNED